MDSTNPSASRKTSTFPTFRMAIFREYHATVWGSARHSRTDISRSALSSRGIHLRLSWQFQEQNRGEQHMSKAVVTADTAFQQFLETERAKPVQRNLFTGEPEPLRVEVPDLVPEDETPIDEGISLVKTEDMAQLIVSGFGLYLGKKSERLVVRKDKTIVYQFPFFRIQELVIGSKGISISSDLMEELCVRGIRINFWGGAGKPYALVSSPYLNATIQTRRDQLMAFNDNRGFEFSRAVVEGKVRNQEKLVRYFGKYLKKADLERFDRINAIADSLAAQSKKVKGVMAATVRLRPVCFGPVASRWTARSNLRPAPLSGIDER